MEELRGLLMTLAGLTLLTAALEHLIPDGRTKKTVMFVMGLLLLLSMISPIASILGRLTDETVAQETLRMEEAFVQRHVAAADDAVYRDQVLASWRRQIEGEAARIAENCGIGIGRATAVIDAAGRLVTLEITGCDEDLEFRDALAKGLSVSQDAIILRP